MRVEELQKKVQAAEEKVEKCKKTIERHRAQMEKKGKKLLDMGIDPETADRRELALNRSEKSQEAYWLLSEYDDKKDDIEGAQKKLKEAERICAGWKEKLDIAINEEMVIQNQVPQVIKDFLEVWKENAFAFYCQRYEDFKEFQADLLQKVREVRLEAYRTVPEYERYRKIQQEVYDGAEPDDSMLINMWPRKHVEALLKERGLDRDTVDARLRNFGDGIIFKMLEFRDVEKREAFLDQVLEDEKKAKMMKLVERISEITGPITDARGLYISGGDLNGVVLGEKGAANVQTVGAGGYNIQCFHYRMLVHKCEMGLDDVLANATAKSNKSDSSRQDRILEME